MQDEKTRVLGYIKAVTDPLTTRVKTIEDVRLKKLEELQKSALEISVLKEAFKKHEREVAASMAHDHSNIVYERAQMTKAYMAYVNAEVTKMDKKLAQTELLEARLKGMETMMRSMEQTIDMLQRRR